MKSLVSIGLDSVVFGHYRVMFECMESYFEKLKEAVDAEKGKLTSMADYLQSKGVSDDYITDYLDEDSFYTSFFENNVYNYALVSLYSECEKILKNDYRILTGKASRNSFKFEILKKLYKDEEIELSSLPYFKDFNILRLLNNCIKHDGYADDNLSKLDSSWKFGEEIKVTYQNLRDFSTKAKAFFDELVPLVDKRNRGQITKEDFEKIKKVCIEKKDIVDGAEKQSWKNIIEKLEKM